MSDFLGLFKNAPDVETHAAGAAVFEAGAPGTSMYVVRRGSVAIRVGGETVETVGPGGLVGEMALLDNKARSATAVALTDCEPVAVDRDRFVFLVQHTPYFALDVMQTMARRRRAMNRRG